MFVFAITFMPLLYGALLGLFDSKDVRKRDILTPFFSGLLLGIPAVLAYWALDVYFSLSWTPLGVYGYAVLHKEGFFYLPPALLLLLRFAFRGEGGGRYREALGFFCGYYFLVAGVEVLTAEVQTVYEALWLPLFRASALMGAACLLNRALDAAGRSRYYWGAGLLAFPLFLNLVPLFHLLNKPVLFHLSGVILFAGIWLLSYLEWQEKLPR